MSVQILQGDCIEVMRTLPAESVNCVVTSPPYWGLRDYGHAGQIGLERTPEEYVASLVAVFREVRRVLRDDGVCWINLGSSYSSHPGQRKTTDKAGPKQRSNSASSGTPSRAASGGSDPNQSPLLWRAPAYGSGGTALPDSQAAGRACHGSGDERQAASPSHRADTAHTDRCAQPSEQQTSQIDRGNGPMDSGQATPRASLPCVPGSTIPQSSGRPLGASGHEATASASQRDTQTTLPASRPFADTSACTSGTSPMSPPLAVRIQGKESFFSACDSPDCRGIGRCGLCWCRLAIPSLTYKAKDMVPIPWLVAMALQADGWWLRSDIVWAKPNPMPESVTDRPTKSHEYLFLLAKSATYYYDAKAIMEPSVTNDTRRPYGSPGSWELDGRPEEMRPRGRPRKIEGPNSHMHVSRAADREDSKPNPSRSALRNPDGERVHGNLPGRDDGGRACNDPDQLFRNKRDVWTVGTSTYDGAHFATFPPALIAPCILAGCPVGGTVLDPFGGSGTTGMVAELNGRNSILIELNPAYIEMAKRRTAQQGLKL